MNYQRAVSVSRFILLLLVISLVISLALFGFNVGGKSMKGILDQGAIRLGLDLAGGSSITYQAKTSDTGDALTTGMESIRRVLDQRLYSQGFSEALVYTVGEDKITVEIPSVADPAEAARTLMATAKLTFRNYEKDILLEGKHVKSASVGYENVGAQSQREYVVQLQLTDEGAKLFEAATKAAAQASDLNHQKIYIWMDETIISEPSVDPQKNPNGIEGDSCIISGNFTDESAKVLAGQINAGALRYELVNVSQTTVGATLGAKSLEMAILAGEISLALIMIFLIIMYRVPGVMASISLLAYMGLFGIILILTKSNLTLPGIAGMVLSMGMAVDANVVIFERIKDELRMGKSVKAAVKAGHSRALGAVTDSNVTTIISSAVLYYLGSGTIKGFAVTLFYGNVIAMFTAIFLSHWLINLSIDMGMSNIKLYGGKKESVRNA